MKKIIRLTESDFQRIVKESVNRVLSEELTYTQLKNILGVDDNDEWNAAAEAERKEELESEVWRAIVKLAGGNPRKNVFEFGDLVNMLNSQFGFKYVGCDEEEESHKFENGKDKLFIYPVHFYCRQGKMKIDNMHIF